MKKVYYISLLPLIFGIVYAVVSPVGPLETPESKGVNQYHTIEELWITDSVVDWKSVNFTNLGEVNVAIIKSSKLIDTDNTNYYVDPYGTSKLNSINLAGTLFSGIFKLQPNGVLFWANDSDYAKIYFNHVGTNRNDLYLYWADDDTDRLVFLHHHWKYGDKITAYIDRNNFVVNNTLILLSVPPMHVNTNKVLAVESDGKVTYVDTSNWDKNSTDDITINNIQSYAVTSLNNLKGDINLLAGSGIAIVTNPITKEVAISNTGVLSLNSLNGNINLVAGNGISISTSGNNIIISANGIITGSGTAGYIPKFNDSQSIINSNLYDGGTYVQSSVEFRAPKFVDSNDEDYYIDPSNTGTSAVFAGKVGIGTDRPLATLHVNGNVIINNVPQSASDYNEVLVIDHANSNIVSYIDTFNWDKNKNDDVIGSGISGYIPKWTGAKTLGNSVIYESNGKVGIGTTSPSYKLDVNGDARVTGKLYVGETIYDPDDSDVNIGEDLTVNGQVKASDGFVQGSPSILPGEYKTRIALDGYYSDFLITIEDGSGRVNIYWNAYYDGSTHKYITSDSAGASRIRIHGNTIQFFTASSGTAGSSITWKTPLTISGEMVGIGTTSPSYKLDVSGWARITGNLYVDSSLGVKGSIFDPDDSDVNIDEDLTVNGKVKATKFVDKDNSNYYIDPSNTGTSAVFAGKVGIGTTSPSYKLDVSGWARVTGRLYVGESIQDPDDSDVNIGENLVVNGYIVAKEVRTAVLEVGYDYIDAIHVVSTSRSHSCSAGGTIKTWSILVGSEFASTNTRVVCNVHERPHGSTLDFGSAVLQVLDAYVDYGGYLRVRTRCSNYDGTITAYLECILIKEES